MKLQLTYKKEISIKAFKIALTALITAATINNSAFAEQIQNSVYGKVSSITYNTPNQIADNSILVEVTDDQVMSVNNEYASCYRNGVTIWYVNLNAHQVVVDKLVERLEKAKDNGTTIRLWGKKDSCADGQSHFNDTIIEVNT